MEKLRTPGQLATATPRTLDELLRRYQMAPEARAASTATKKMRARAFSRAVHRFNGTTPLSEIESRGFRARLYDWRDSFADIPNGGKNTLKFLIAALNWAVDRGYMRDNPGSGMKKLACTSDRSEMIWGPEELAALRAVAPPGVMAVVDVAALTGLRIGDVLDLRAYHFEDGWLTVTPQKTRRMGVKVQLPYYVLPPLAAAILRILATSWKADAHVLRDPLGRPWAYPAYQKAFVRACAAAGLTGTGLRFHDLRGTLITRLLEAGCSQAEAGSISGHNPVTGNMRSYAARTRPLAESAYRKLAAYLEEYPVL